MNFAKTFTERKTRRKCVTLRASLFSGTDASHEPTREEKTPADKDGGRKALFGEISIEQE